MERKEKILAFIQDENYIPLKAEEIAVLLAVLKNDFGQLCEILDTLSDEGKIYKTKKNKYLSTDNDPQIFSGVLSCNSAKGFGFLRCDSENEKDIFIPMSAMNGAYDRDRVLVRIDSRDSGGPHREGHIIKILERGNKNIVGVVRGYKNGKYAIVPDRREFFAEIHVPHGKHMEAKKGDRVLAAIDKYSDKSQPYGSVIAILGKNDSIKGCLDGLILSNSYSKTFSDAVCSETELLPDKVRESDMIDREDLRKLITFTIDGDDSKDFDDAISLEITGENHMLLGVHIADVSHYVKENSELDREASERASSVYFPNTVISMLPEKLSNGICSLNPNEDRLTLSVFMEFDNNANMHSHRISKSVIHSHERLTYKTVNKLLSGDGELAKKYETILPILKNMDILARKLEEKRHERGAIDFDFSETKIICNEDAVPTEIIKYKRGRAEKIIESFMLAANETVAETAYWSELPFVYRVHKAPNNKKLSEFNNFIVNFGYSLKCKADSDMIHPKVLQTISEKVKGTPEETMISKMMLRSLMKACYRETNEGHFGLSAKYYCHFTSPIRRYPDLFVHRMLKSFIDGNMLNDTRLHYEEYARKVSEISTEKEIAAENAERDACDLLKAAYMHERIGETCEAVVSSVTSFGVFAMLDNSCEGLIRYETMKHDYFEFDDATHSAVGKRTGKTFKIGDIVKITVAAADIISRRIDFVLTEDADKGNIKRIARRIKPKKAAGVHGNRHSKKKRKRNER